MRARIKSLAQLMKDTKSEGRKFVLLLGAGASMSAGVPSTPKIIEELLEKYGSHITGTGNDERFDELWRTSTEKQRAMFLQPYLDQEPSPGYEKLVDLIKHELIDIVVTFNFDKLVEKSLNNAGLTDHQVIVRGEHDDAAIAKLIEAPKPRIKVLKLHGSLFGADNFLFSKDEMHKYPEPLEKVVESVTASDIIVCGYAFNDLCVSRCFADKGGSIFCVDPSAVPAHLKGFMGQRKSRQNYIGNEFGYFDKFFETLHEELLGAPRKKQESTLNPFKFLETYDVDDKEWFFGRKKLSQELLGEFVTDSKPAVIHLVGPPKSGKTSFVRAGFIAHLPTPVYRPVYVRCHEDLEEQICDCMRRRLDVEPENERLDSLIMQIDDAFDEHVVLVLDQFERIVERHGAGAEGERQFGEFLERLCEVEHPGLTLVLVGVENPVYFDFLARHGAKAGVYKRLHRLEPQRVAAILRLLVRRAGLDLQRDVIQRLVERYKRGMDADRPFTLAHVQALCYMMARAQQSNVEHYEALTQAEEVRALDAAINEFDIIGFLDDFPIKEEGMLVRKIMEVVSDPSKRMIAGFVKEHFPEILTQHRYPPAVGDSAEKGRVH